MASIKVCDPVSIPLFVYEELQELRAQVAQFRQENERLRQENERLRRELAEAKASLDQAKRQSKRQAAPFSKGPPKPYPKRPGRKAGAAHGRHGHRLPPPPPRSMKSSRRPSPTLALTAAAVSAKLRLPRSIRPKSPDGPSYDSSTSTSAVVAVAASASRGATRSRPPMPSGPLPPRSAPTPRPPWSP